MNARAILLRLQFLHFDKEILLKDGASVAEINGRIAECEDWLKVLNEDTYGSLACVGDEYSPVLPVIGDPKKVQETIENFYEDLINA